MLPKHYIIKVMVIINGIISQFWASEFWGSWSKMMSQPPWSKKRLNDAWWQGCPWKILFYCVSTPRNGNWKSNHQANIEFSPLPRVDLHCQADIRKAYSRHRMLEAFLSYPSWVWVYHGNMVASGQTENTVPLKGWTHRISPALHHLHWGWLTCS